MSNEIDCLTFRRMVYHPSGREVNKVRESMNAHESSCASCNIWLLADFESLEHDLLTPKQRSTKTRNIRKIKARLEVWQTQEETESAMRSSDETNPFEEGFKEGEESGINPFSPMTCDKFRQLVDGGSSGEWNLHRHEMDEHGEACLACSALVDAKLKGHDFTEKPHEAFGAVPDELPPEVA